jgi:hypothetical membrane protein
VLSLICLGLTGIFVTQARWLLGGELIVYLIVELSAGLLAAIRRRDAAMAFGLPLGIATMHITWGAGFLWSLLSLKKR